jgi:hypothetical protein
MARMRRELSATQRYERGLGAGVVQGVAGGFVELTAGTAGGLDGMPAGVGGGSQEAQSSG